MPAHTTTFTRLSLVRPFAFFIAVVAVATLQTGCTNQTGSANRSPFADLVETGSIEDSNTNGSSRSSQGFVSEAEVITGVPFALLDDEPITYESVSDLLAEAAGGIVLREIAIDRAIQQRLSAGRLEVADAHIAQERRILLDSLHADAGVAARLLKQLRVSRNLGPRRYSQFIRRNASLRLLIADQIIVTPEMIQHEFERFHGPLHIIRLITTQRRGEAEDTLLLLRSGEPFIDHAVRVSTHSSAVVGGLLPPFSMHDESVPMVIRQIIEDLLPNEISPIIALADQYAIVQLIEHRKRDQAEIQQERLAIEASLRRVQERLLMDGLVQEMFSDIDLLILNAAAHDGWQLQYDR